MQICFLVRTNSKDTGKGRVIIVSTYCFSLSSTSSSPITELLFSLGNYPNSLLVLIVGAPVQFSSVAQSCPTLCDPRDCSTPGFPVHHQLPELAQTHVHWISDAIQPSYPLLSPSPPTFNLSRIRVFSNESVLCIRWPNDWSFSFSISPSNEYSGLIPFRTDWFDFLAVQWTVKSLLQYHSSKASILRCSAFLMVQLSHPHMTTGKTIALTIGTFVSKVISLLHMQCAESVRSSEDLGHQSLVSLCGPAIKLSLLQHFGFFGLTVCQAHQGDRWKQGITRTVLLELSTQGLRINLGVPGAMPSIWSRSL